MINIQKLGVRVYGMYDRLEHRYPLHPPFQIKSHASPSSGAVQIVCTTKDFGVFELFASLSLGCRIVIVSDVSRGRREKGKFRERAGTKPLITIVIPTFLPRSIRSCL